MQVRKRLNLNSAVLIVAAVVIALLLGVGLYRVNGAFQELDIADEILNNLFLRSTFRSDYLRTGSERAKQQLLAQHARTVGLLESASRRFRDPADGKLIHDMTGDHRSTAELFTDIVENREKARKGTLPADLAGEIENRLLTQLNIRSYSSALNVQTLRASARKSFVAELRLTGVSVAVLIIIVAAVAGISSWVTGRFLADRVARLREGSSIIGEGNLDHRIEIEGDDEFAELSRSFDAMTENLRTFRLKLEEEIAEHRQAEEETRTTLERFYTILSSMYTALLLVKADDRVEFANQAFCDYFDLEGSPSDLVGLTSSEIVEKVGRSYRDPDKAIARVREIIDQGQPVRDEEEVMTGGRVRLRNFIPIYIGGKAWGRLWHYTDITERKKAEERLRTTLESIADGFFACDEDWRFVYVNAPAERILGFRREEVLGKSHWEVFPLTLGTKLEEEYRRAAAGEVRDFENFYEPWGRWFHNRCSPREGGGMSVYFQDITEHKQMEQQLEAHRLLLEGIMDQMPAGVSIVKAKDLRVLYVNPAYQSFARDREMVGRTLQEVWPEIFPRLQKIFRDVLETGRRHAEVDQPYFARRSPAGPVEKRYFTWSLARIAMPDGDWGLLNTAWETTETKRLGEEVRRSRDELELRVRERTAELEQAYDRLTKETAEREQAEQQLRRGQKLEALGTLAGGIAHDFNNVLTGVIGFAEMVLERLTPGSKEHRRLELALKGAYRGRDLVKQILAFSRKGEQERKPLALARTVDEALALLRPALPSTIEIVWRSPAEGCRILADPVQMQQVLMNLCTNAAHAMREEGGVLEIAVSEVLVTPEGPPPFAEMEPGEYVVLEVGDTGCGMDPDTLEQIFDPFFTTKREGEGTGLGLSVTYGIVKTHGGHIAVESEPGKGSRFHVYLPGLSETGDKEDTRAPSSTGGNERILLVDDEDILVELNGERLRDLGYDVVATTASIEALRIFQEEPDRFDLILVDQTMPNLTGMDLAARLLERRPDIPIILCTGHGDRISLEALREAGIRDLLLKPFNKQELAGAIRRVLDTKVNE